ncbi:PD-(D/E)XK nuclease family protein [Kribbella qitaiheensis]|uniref:PD-(D/E)XK nuclease family protein n=1 Tax=Kribbella qitaiheensis TaxID=1544730 RepID=UPI00360A6684
MNDRLKVVEDLVANPWYQLSTAGHELFHTNMLYWLARQHAEGSEAIWDLLAVDAPTDSSKYRIRREWKHVDLFVDAGPGQRKLVLENKVGAIPTVGQLSAYRVTLLRDHAFDDERTSWRLLSLLPPTFSLPAPWRPVNYADLLPAIEAASTKLDGAARHVVAGYSSLVRQLVTLRDKIDPLAELNSPMFLDAGEKEVLHEGRLLALVLKMQMSRCAEVLNAGIDGLLTGPRPKVVANFSRGEGLVEWLVPGPRGRHFGWQAQGRQFRLVGITSDQDPRARSQREQLMDLDHESYFNFDLPDGLAGLLNPYRGQKVWLGYEPDFVYRYATLKPDITWRQFMDLATWFTSAAHSYASTNGVLPVCGCGRCAAAI